MVEFFHTDKRSGCKYRTRIPLAVTHELRFYAPCNESMFVWLDAKGRDVGGGTLVSEMDEYKFLPEDPTLASLGQPTSFWAQGK